MSEASHRLNFTKAAIDALPAAPVGRRVYYNDTKVRGLQLVVTDRGTKTFCLYGRSGGRPHRHKLGRYPALVPEQARRLGEEARGRLAGGVDLRAERQAEVRSRVSLKDAFTAFKVARAALRPRTLYDYGRYVAVAFEDWQSRPLVEITKDMVAARHRRLSEQNGPAYADGAMRCLRSILNFAQFRYESPDGAPLLPANPVQRLSQTRAWNRPKRRTTYIKANEFSAWFAAVLQLKADPERRALCTIADWLLMTMLTGLRRNEGLQLRWDDVHLDPKRAMFTVRGTKNGEDHTLPLSDYLLELLTGRHGSRAEGAEFVFGSWGAEGHLIDPRVPIATVVETSGVKFTVHDLRRTFITVAESLDIPAYALKRMLNHKMSNDITAGYIITDVERLRKPMQQVTDFILRSAGLKQTAEVAELPRSAQG